MFLYLQLFVAGRMRYLRYLCLFLYSGVHHVLCCGFCFFVILKFVSDLRQEGGFLRALRFPPPKKLPATISYNIVESGVKHHTPNPLSWTRGLIIGRRISGIRVQFYLALLRTISCISASRSKYNP
jgi:hypothetical protein